MDTCYRMHCGRTLGLARYAVTYRAEGVPVTDTRMYCGEHAEGVHIPLDCSHDGPRCAHKTCPNPERVATA
jgi:hypothetical protein